MAQLLNGVRTGPLFPDSSSLTACISVVVFSRRPVLRKAAAPLHPLGRGSLPRATGKTITRRGDTLRRGNALSRCRHIARDALQRVGSSEARIAFAEGRHGATC